MENENHSTTIDVRSELRIIYDRLLSAFGAQHWWPGDSEVEIVVGAILTQNTAWTNVELAITNLKQADCMTWTALRDIKWERLAETIRPAGTYRIKANRLKEFVGVLWGNHGGSLEALLSGELCEARNRLLSIHGVGPETADAILLYAGNRPTFVIDAYTQRILRRHWLTEDRATYEATRQLMHRNLPHDATLFNEFHALLVAVGKRYCRSQARCTGCPLEARPHDETR